jgi:hypothetical protein
MFCPGMEAACLGSTALTRVAPPSAVAAPANGDAIDF